MAPDLFEETAEADRHWSEIERRMAGLGFLAVASACSKDAGSASSGATSVPAAAGTAVTTTVPSR